MPLMAQVQSPGDWEQHRDADDTRPAQLAGHVLMHFWIGASAARASMLTECFCLPAPMLCSSLPSVLPSVLEERTAP